MTMRLAFPLMLSLLAAAGAINLFTPDGQRVGVVREGPGGQVEIFDRDSRRIGWGRRNPDGSIEVFGADGRPLALKAGMGSCAKSMSNTIAQLRYH
jgi:hypothetical protein